MLTTKQLDELKDYMAGAPIENVIEALLFSHGDLIQMLARMQADLERLLGTKEETDAVLGLEQVHYAFRARLLTEVAQADD